MLFKTKPNWSKSEGDTLNNRITLLTSSSFDNLPAFAMRLTNLTVSSMLEYQTQQNWLSLYTEISAGWDKSWNKRKSPLFLVGIRIGEIHRVGKGIIKRIHNSTQFNFFIAFFGKRLHCILTNVLSVFVKTGNCVPVYFNLNPNLRPSFNSFAASCSDFSTSFTEIGDDPQWI